MRQRRSGTPSPGSYGAPRFVLLLTAFALHAGDAAGGTPGASRYPAVSARAVCPAHDEIAFAESVRSEEFSQLQQSVAALAGGGFATVWLAGDFGQRSIFMQWFDSTGRARFPPGGIPVALGLADFANVIIVADAAGGAHVAFELGVDIFVQRFDASGQPLWPGLGVLAAQRALDQVLLHPHLVPAAAGGVFACFQYWSAGPVLDIRCQLLDGAGNRTWTDSGVSACSGGNAELRVVPRGVSDGSGGLLLFWRNQGDINGLSPGPMLMEAQHFAANGQTLWEAPKVVRTTSLPSNNSHTFRFFQVVSDGGGGAVLAFDDWVTAPELALDVVAQRVSGSGDLLWGAGAVVTSAAGTQQHEQTIGSGDGGAYVAVLQYVTDSHNRILLFRLGPDGNHAWSPSGVLVSDPEATALDFFVSGSLNNGVLRLAWTHQTTPFTFEMDVLLASYTAGGIRTGTHVLSRSRDGQFLAGGFAWSDAFGGLLAAWDDRRKGTWNDLDVGGALWKDSASCRTGLFYTLAPCRLLDTREPGGARLASDVPVTVEAVGDCGVPSSAAALALTVTAVAPSASGHLALSPANHFRPLTSSLNLRLDRTRANNAILPLSIGGGFTVFPFLTGGGNTHLLVDVTGYFE